MNPMMHIHLGTKFIIFISIKMFRIKNVDETFQAFYNTGPFAMVLQ